LVGWLPGIRLGLLDALKMGPLRSPETSVNNYLGFPVLLVSLSLKANAEMVPKIPSYQYMLLM